MALEHARCCHAAKPHSYRKNRLPVLARDGISAIWKLQIGAAEAHSMGYPGSARVIVEIAEAAEQPWLRPALDCSFADMIGALR